MPVRSTLRTGDRGPQVQLLQLALARAGFDPGAPDGVFGSRTLDALLRFQRSAGLLPDGLAGPRTWNALEPYLTGFRTHTIQRGDTLYRLATRFSSTVRAIETANPGLDPFQLEPGRRLTIPLGFSVVPTTIAFSSDVLDYAVRGITARYPFVRASVIGQSVLGRPLYVLTLGTGANQVFYNAAHHANEWITSPLLLTFLEDYARAYALGGTVFGLEARALAAETTLHLTPMVNPDGVDLAVGALNGSAAWRQASVYAANYPQIPFPSGWKANIAGVDPNLQYPAGWEEAKRIKYAQGYVSPAPRDYVGAAPLEAPESRALYDYTQRNDFALTLSYHTQGRVIYWKYRNYAPEGAEAIAMQFAAVSGYTPERTPTVSDYAGYKDWFIDACDRPGFTIEAGAGVSPLPLSQFDEIYADNEGILTLGLRPFS